MGLSADRGTRLHAGSGSTNSPARSRPANGDPLGSNLTANDQVGLVVIEFATRRRMRLNGSAEMGSDGTLYIHARQVYSNCPKYIQARGWERRRAETGLTQKSGGNVGSERTTAMDSCSGYILCRQPSPKRWRRCITSRRVPGIRPSGECESAGLARLFRQHDVSNPRKYCLLLTGRAAVHRFWVRQYPSAYRKGANNLGPSAQRGSRARSE